MIKSEKKLKELTTMFGRKNKEAITGAVLLLREKDPFEGVISLLASFYNESDDFLPLRKVIEEFFNDIKDNSVRPEVIAEIRKPWKPNTISMLVSSCWQSGLDYSDYLTDLTKVFLKSDYATAVECMTVISESVNNSSRERKDEIIGIVKDSPLSFTNEKLALTEELISILKR